MAISDTLSINKTAKAVFVLFFRYPDGRPFDLTGATEIRGLFPAEDQNTEDVEINMSSNEIQIMSACQGTILCTMVGSKTALLKAGEDQSFEFLVILNNDVSNPSVVQFTESLTVNARFFP